MPSICPNTARSRPSESFSSPVRRFLPGRPRQEMTSEIFGICRGRSLAVSIPTTLLRGKSDQKEPCVPFDGLGKFVRTAAGSKSSAISGYLCASATSFSSTVVAHSKSMTNPNSRASEGFAWIVNRRRRANSVESSSSGG